MNLNIPSPITKINSNFLDKKCIQIFIKRDDLIHNIISGNKWRKLKHNLIKMQAKGYDSILSFGGQYSNHLHALGYIANNLGFNSIGVIRGVGKSSLSGTLSFCQDQNMQFHYMDYKTYRHKKYDNKTLSMLRDKFGDFYFLPEGGANYLGVKGCVEIVDEIEVNFDYLCCAVGTGCTAAGLISAICENQNFIGFCPFNKCFEQEQSILNLCPNIPRNNWQLISDNHFNGFGKINSNLIKFVRRFYDDFNIKLDLIYMGKLFYSLFELIKQDYFIKNTTIMVVNSGGLQGLDGFNFKY